MEHTPFHNFKILKLQDKTKNDWEDRADFFKYNGKYDLVKMDYTAGEKQVEINSFYGKDLITHFF